MNTQTHAHIEQQHKRKEKKKKYNTPINEDRFNKMNRTCLHLITVQMRKSLRCSPWHTIELAMLLLFLFLWLLVFPFYTISFFFYRVYKCIRNQKGRVDSFFSSFFFLDIFLKIVEISLIVDRWSFFVLNFILIFLCPFWMEKGGFSTWEHRCGGDNSGVGGKYRFCLKFVMLSFSHRRNAF